jgi:hypothetical protein
LVIRKAEKGEEKEEEKEKEANLLRRMKNTGIDAIVMPAEGSYEPPSKKFVDADHIATRMIPTQRRDYGRHRV